MKKINRIGAYFILLLLVVSCASSNVQTVANTSQEIIANTPLTHRFYVVGGASEKTSQNVLAAVEKELQKETSEEKHLIFIGDNIEAKKKDTSSVKQQLDRQIAVMKNKAVSSYMLPGNREWDFNGIKGLEFIEDYLEKQLQQDDILTPNNGCPLESIEISEHIQLITLDSQWFIEDWDKRPGFNDKCDIKSREKLLSELEGELKKNANKFILFAMHHPLFTNGIHGGKFSARDHIFPLGGKIPLPVVATLITEIRSQGAPSVQDRFNKQYRALAEAVGPMLSDQKLRVLVVSGHEKNLQFIKEGSIKQIISGSGSDGKPASLGDNGLFSFGGDGFNSIEVFKDGSIWTTFYKVTSEGISEVIFQKKVFEPIPEFDLSKLPSTFPKTVMASVYTKEEVDKSEFFKSFWGNHYRAVYGTAVEAEVAVLDTLYGGLEVVRPGGGHQTRSLRLVTKSGKEYNMRALRKSAVQFLESTAFKGVDGEQYFSNTLTEDLISDFYTAAHPYGAFAIPEIAKAAEIYYTKPKLYFVPKQKRLGKYNDDYGDQLYMIVERPTDDFKGRKHFGNPDDIESTDDVLSTLREDEDYRIDEQSYIRARIFDMLLGDWDRHSDQWRWAVFEDTDGKKVFEPIPRDRDQVFANFDGKLLNALRNVMGSVNQFGVYGPTITNIEWFNKAGIKLDRALIKRSDRSVWLAEARFLQNAITQETLDRAFVALPEAVQDSTLREIKDHFIGRKANLEEIVKDYYQTFIKFQTLTGTDKDDHFEITRLQDGITKIKAYRIKDGKKGELLFDRSFNSDETNEIWLYGLDDKDVFEVTGQGDRQILIRIVGGQEKDSYSVKQGKRIKIYDSNTKKSEVLSRGGAQFRFTDFYEANVYNYQKEPSSSGGISLSSGYDPDNGVTLSAGYSKERVDFITNPFGQRFGLHVDYSFLTKGVDLRLEKTFAAIFKDYNFVVEGRFTSDQFTENFFGFGNETENFDNTLGNDFNRVGVSRYNAAVGVERESDYGSFFQVKLEMESVALLDTAATLNILEERNYYFIPQISYRYKNFDDTNFVTRGMLFSIRGGGIDTFNDDKITGFLDAGIDFYNSISHNDQLVLRTAAQTQLTFGDRPVFFQSPSVGSDSGLRGFRSDRFRGDQSLAGSIDLNYKFRKIKTALFPIDLSMYGGVDSGRVWITEEDSNLWHYSYGGGINASYTDALKGVFGLFTGEEGIRLTGALQFTF